MTAAALGFDPADVPDQRVHRAHGRASDGKSRAWDLRTVRDDVSNTRVETTLVEFPPDGDHDEQQVFLMNLAGTDEIYLIDIRFVGRSPLHPTDGIETAYGGTKQFAP